MLLAVLTLNLLQKWNLKILSAQVICCIYFLTLLKNINIDVYSVDSDQTATIGAV